MNTGLNHTDVLLIALERVAEKYERSASVDEAAEVRKFCDRLADAIRQVIRERTA